MRLKAGLIFLGATCGIFSIGALVAPPWASAHEITGFAATSACVPDAGLDWTFTSSNAGTHVIVDAQFNRRVDLISQTATTVKVHSAEKPGVTSLSITVTWDDAHVSHFTASTVVLDGVCPPPTTTPPTEVTTSPSSPTTPPSSSSVVVTTPSVTNEVVSAPPTSTAAMHNAEPTTITRSINLPTTGTGSTIVWVAVAILAGGTVAILITVRRRRP